jgi:hypothetical protein
MFCRLLYTRIDLYNGFPVHLGPPDAQEEIPGGAMGDGYVTVLLIGFQEQYRYVNGRQRTKEVGRKE